jgi:hypothetical protein
MASKKYTSNTGKNHVLESIEGKSIPRKKNNNPFTKGRKKYYKPNSANLAQNISIEVTESQPTTPVYLSKLNEDVIFNKMICNTFGKEVGKNTNTTLTEEEVLVNYEKLSIMLKPNL